MQLTRTQVARRLGKSVATVRRLEGRALFPSRDWRGVHRFDDWEVEQLRESPAQLRDYARSEWFEAQQQRAQAARRTGLAGARGDLAIRGARADHNMTNGDVLAGALELLADRLSLIAARTLIRAGIDEELFELVLEALDLVRDRNG